LYGLLPESKFKNTARRNVDANTFVDLYEARAVLLGRMGRHDHALELYVYKLRDYAKAEECVFPLPNLDFLLTLS
jgi:hypothetical protein